MNESRPAELIFFAFSRFFKQMYLSFATQESELHYFMKIWDVCITFSANTVLFSMDEELEPNNDFTATDIPTCTCMTKQADATRILQVYGEHTI